MSKLEFYIKNKLSINHKLNRSIGYTLAEVLLVITIIGVIASLTIPDLVASVQEVELNAAVKKTYSEVSIAWNKFIDDKGGTPINKFTSYNDLRDNFLRKYFAYSKVSTVYQNQRVFYYLEKTGSYTNNVGITRNDGVYLGIGNASSTCTLQGFPNVCAQLIMDVNGEKGPNRSGYDVFWVNLMTDRVFPGDARYASSHDINKKCIKPGNTGWDFWTNSGDGCINRILLNLPKWSG